LQNQDGVIHVKARRLSALGVAIMTTQPNELAATSADAG
jgi:hypothetical protein